MTAPGSPSKKTQQAQAPKPDHEYFNFVRLSADQILPWFQTVRTRMRELLSDPKHGPVSDWTMNADLYGKVEQAVQYKPDMLTNGFLRYWLDQLVRYESYRLWNSVFRNVFNRLKNDGASLRDCENQAEKFANAHMADFVKEFV